MTEVEMRGGREAEAAREPAEGRADEDDELIREAIKDPLVRRHLAAMLRAFGKRLGLRDRPGRPV